MSDDTKSNTETELQAMAEIVAIFERLSDSERRRVYRYLLDRYRLSGSRSRRGE